MPGSASARFTYSGSNGGTWSARLALSSRNRTYRAFPSFALNPNGVWLKKCRSVNDATPFGWLSAADFRPHPYLVWNFSYSNPSCSCRANANSRKFRAVVKKQWWPVFSCRSNGLRNRLSVNLMAALRTGVIASSMYPDDECRRRIVNSRPGVKNSHSGNCGLSTILSLPRPTSPLLCDIRRRFSPEPSAIRKTKNFPQNQSWKRR